MITTIMIESDYMINDRLYMFNDYHDYDAKYITPTVKPQLELYYVRLDFNFKLGVLAFKFVEIILDSSIWC